MCVVICKLRGLALPLIMIAEPGVFMTWAPLNFAQFPRLVLFVVPVGPIPLNMAVPSLLLTEGNRG